MAILHIENFPDALYQALRERARKNGRSIAAEVIALLETAPTPTELKRRERLLRQAEKSRKGAPLAPGPFPSTEDMVREDRQR